jgi:Thioesterase-like superfamily
VNVFDQDTQVSADGEVTLTDRWNGIYGVPNGGYQLTVYLRARPAPGWLACRAVTRYVTSAYHEEDFEVWDSAGTLVAQSRQLCMIVR